MLFCRIWVGVKEIHSMEQGKGLSVVSVCSLSGCYSCICPIELESGLAHGRIPTFLFLNTLAARLFRAPQETTINELYINDD